MKKIKLFSALSGKEIERANTDEEYADDIKKGMDMTLTDMGFVCLAMDECPCVKGKTIGEIMELLLFDDGTFEAQLEKELMEMDET